MVRVDRGPLEITHLCTNIPRGGDYWQGAIYEQEGSGFQSTP